MTAKGTFPASPLPPGRPAAGPTRCRAIAGALPAFALGAFGLAAVLSATLVPDRAAAHPHAWITLQTTAIVDPEGRVTALRQRWRFDEFYTLFVLEDTGGEAPDDEAIDNLMRQNLANLAPYGYFTELADDAGPVGYAGVEEIDGRLQGDRLEMTFTLRLDRPLGGADGPVDYAIFDPSYYVEMRHEDGVEAIDVQPAGACEVALERPDPDPEWLMMAAAADLGGPTSSDLGRLFAERVRLHCDPPR